MPHQVVPNIRHVTGISLETRGEALIGKMGPITHTPVVRSTVAMMMLQGSEVAMTVKTPRLPRGHGHGHGRSKIVSLVFS
jgi:hypothetical protein